MSRHRHTLRQAFVTTVAVAAASVIGGGCTNELVITNPPYVDDCPAAEPASGESCELEGLSCSFIDSCTNSITYGCADGAWNITDSVSCNPPPPDECPDVIPFDGDPCGNIGQFCDFGLNECGDNVTGTCTQQGWVTMAEVTCNPPPAECPAELPVMGSACAYDPDSFDGFPSNCGYDIETPCGVQRVVASCVGDSSTEAIWQFDTPPTCEAPAAQCQAYGQASSCEADPGCSWRVPGCSSPETAPSLDVAGCFPSADCTTDGCGDWGTCSLVVHNPCWNSLCDACGAEANVCIPN